LRTYSSSSIVGSAGGCWLLLCCVPGNPLNDIRLLERPDFVLKDGVLVRGPMDRQAGLADSFAGDMTVETS
jgi:hypothetical protein